MSGSCTGAAAHVHACTTSLKCSAANTCTAWSAASAVPIAFVPAPPSLHSAPTAKFIEFAAASRTAGAPSSHSSVPSASLTTIRCAASSAIPARHSRISGATDDERMDLPARRGLVVVGDRRRGAARGSDRRRPRTSAARSRRSGARTESGRPPPTNRSQARRTSRARRAGEVVASIASQGFRNRLPSGPGSAIRAEPTVPPRRAPATTVCSAVQRRAALQTVPAGGARRPEVDAGEVECLTTARPHGAAGEACRRRAPCCRC